jgi:hypothetical protein
MRPLTAVAILVTSIASITALVGSALNVKAEEPKSPTLIPHQELFHAGIYTKADRQGDEIGYISGLLFQMPPGGPVIFVVSLNDGFLGVGDTWVNVPSNQFSYEVETDGSLNVIFSKGQEALAEFPLSE